MNNLRYLRKMYNLTMRELADYTGMSHPTIFKLEKEERPFRQSHIDLLTSFFDVTTDYLLGRSETGLYVFPEYGEEKLLLSINEYKRLAGNITTSVMPRQPININISINNDRTIIKNSSHFIYKELKGEAKDYELNGSLENEIASLVSKMSVDEQKQTIKFIKEFIIK